MPRRSPGVLATAFGDGLLLHDALRHEIHVLNPAGAVVWAACDGATLQDELVAEVVAVTGQRQEAIAADIRTHLDQLRAAGLVDRPPLPDPVTPPVDGPIDEPFALRSLRVLDEAVEVRSNDRALLAAVRATFGDLYEVDRPPTGRVGLMQLDDGRVRIYGRGHDRVVAVGDELDDAVASWLNRMVAPSRAMVAFHAGAVRSPEGRVVVIAGESGAGKSTLTGALVQAGWDYLTDEAVGVRAGRLDAVGYPKPLSLDAASRRLLGLTETGSSTVPVSQVRPGARAALGDAGPLALVVFPDRLGNLDEGPRALAPADAVVALAPNAINLGPSGPEGLEVLAQIATTVACVRLGTSELPAAAATILALATIEGSTSP